MKPVSLVSATATTTTTTTTLVVLLLLLSSPSPSDAGLQCPTVVGYLRTCVAYLKSGPQARPAESCCEGVRALVRAARSVQDKRDACNCVKATAQITNPDPENARDLPNICGIILPFAISPFFDCSRIG